MTNNGEIVFPYRKAKKDFGITSRRFLAAIDMLVEKGFIDIAEPGNPAARTMTKFAISERWRKYGDKDFKKQERAKGQSVGFCSPDKRWKHGDTLECTQKCVRGRVSKKLDKKPPGDSV
jgi:hypothetical protein